MYSSLYETAELNRVDESRSASGALTKNKTAVIGVRAERKAVVVFVKRARGARKAKTNAQTESHGFKISRSLLDLPRL